MPEIAFTRREVTALRMALRWGVPDPEPAEIAAAREKLEEAESHGAIPRKEQNDA
jgi:hypothetical protein